MRALRSPLTAIAGGLIGGLLGALIACTTTSAFTCSSDSECVGGGVDGTCEPSGSCSFPDAECPSGKRFGDLAAGGIGGVCVDGDTSSTGAETSTSSTSSTTLTTTSPSTSTTSACSELGAACADASDCCDPCMACEGDVCVADVGGRGDCDSCEACDENASCAPAGDGSACLFECSNLVWGDSEAEGVLSCHRYTPAMIAGLCDAEGGCNVGNQKDCAAASGEAIVSCDAACALQMTGCTQGTPAAEITLESLCATDEEAPSCKPTCADGTTSIQSCDSLGTCMESEAVECAPFICGADGCKADCKSPMDCADGFSCVMKVCE